MSLALLFITAVMCGAWSRWSHRVRGRVQRGQFGTNLGPKNTLLIMILGCQLSGDRE